MLRILTAALLLVAVPASLVPVARLPRSGRFVAAGDLAVPAVCLSAALLVLLQLAAAAAGRGRATLLRRGDGWVRAVLTALTLAGGIELAGGFPTARPPGVASTAVAPAGIAAAAVATAALALAARAASAWTERSVLLAAWLAWAGLRTLAWGGAADAALWLAITAAPTGFVLAALRVPGIGRRELGLAGVRPWAPGDVALAPFAAMLVALIPIALPAMGPGAGLGSVNELVVLTALASPLLLTVPVARALVYIRDRIDLAEARAARRGVGL